MNTQWSCTDTHTGLLRRLWNDNPERREAMASAMAAHGTVRSYLARRHEDFFAGKGSSWAKKHWHRQVDATACATNNTDIGTSVDLLAPARPLAMPRPGRRLGDSLW